MKDFNAVKETSFSSDVNAQEIKVEGEFENDDQKTKIDSHPVIDMEVWNEIKAQGPAVTIKLFLKNYCLYVFNRIVRYLLISVFE